MAAKKTGKTAKNPKPSFVPVKIAHSTAEKKKWAMVKHRGRWAFAKANAARPPGPHTVCKYDPNTGFYDDCQETT